MVRETEEWVSLRDEIHNEVQFLLFKRESELASREKQQAWLGYGLQIDSDNKVESETLQHPQKLVQPSGAATSLVKGHLQEP